MVEVSLAMWNLLEQSGAVCREPDGQLRTGLPLPRAILPGSFNPLHQGHTALAGVAAARLGTPVSFELSVVNVDKPELPSSEVDRRLSQFDSVGPVWVTRAATFAAKAECFPGVVFVLGWDTAERLVHPRYYGSEAARDSCLCALRDCGCVLVVGGRLDTQGIFQTWKQEGIADEFRTLFVPLQEVDFRVDISSTALRSRVTGSGGK
jgi:hypothetical protein